MPYIVVFVKNTSLSGGNILNVNLFIEWSFSLRFKDSMGRILLPLPLKQPFVRDKGLNFGIVSRELYLFIIVIC